MDRPEERRQILGAQTVKSKARSATAAKPNTVKPKARPQQRIAISHHREEDFKADGLRAYAKYRDLGIADATQRPGAGACDPPGRPVQSGGSLKTALPRRRVPDGLCAQRLGEDLHGRAGRDLDEGRQRLDPAAAHQAHDPGLFRRRGIAGSDPAGGVQDGGIVRRETLVIPGWCASTRPGISNSPMCNGTSEVRRFAPPGHDGEIVTSSPPRSRPSGTSSACPRRSISARAN